MENVFNAVKAMEKASAREIAARLGVEPKEALEKLTQLEARGELVSLNGYWSVNDNPPPAAAEKRVNGNSKTQQKLIDIIQLSGEISAAELAERADLSPAVVSASLATAFGAHKVKRAKVNGKIYYFLPDFPPQAATPPAPQGHDYRAIVEKIAEIFHGSVTDIPLLTVTAQSYKDRLAKVEDEHAELRKGGAA
ncbi:winged helix-turn-helix domain-containing protein [Cronobacter muytjensii]|uniref:winged helix-turn-helix domain-containing protein n=1 Tax=Cronobacter muytjensii TaxID=413501 RepID=UPI002DBCF056|nr:winged helix-turn-helix domain-containing protein [Cronobacter muytjensii]MEB8638628.1 winged helix-turn-helix domain-containing protein [Cronobacter muytjensii]